MADSTAARALPFVATEGFKRRGRALLRAAPLHDLASRSAARRAWGDDARADVRTFAVAAIDAVVSRSNLPDEFDKESLITTLAGLARTAMPDADDTTCDDLAAYVVDGLLNSLDESGGAFRYTQGEWDQTGYRVREATFRLLAEQSRADGRVVLTATVEAINALRSGLDFDVENARKANDYILQLQLQNNDLNEAEVTAQRGLQLSAEYAAQLERDLDATRLDLTLVDWQGTVLARIAAARDHVGSRIAVAHVLLGHLDDGEESRDTNLREPALRISALLDQCLQQDRRLHARLQGAHDIYLGEQSRQVLARRAGLSRLALRTDILDPLVALSVGAAEPVVATFAQHASGALRPRRPRLADLVDDLMRPVRSRTAADTELETLPEFTEVLPPFSDDDVDAAAAILDTARLEPVAASTLLAAAQSHGSRIAELVRCAVLWMWSPGDDTDADPVLARIAGVDMSAVRIRRDTPHAWAGDEFLVAPLDVLADHGLLDEPDDTLTDDPHVADAQTPTVDADSGLARGNVVVLRPAATTEALKETM